MEHLRKNTGKFEWYTPAPILDSVRDVMGRIDLDPATSDMANRIVKAEKIYTIADDGLLQDWTGRVWLNPPYARRIIDKWIDKLIAEYRKGHISEWMCLVNNATDTRWAQRLLANSVSVCFLQGRIRFETPEGPDKNGPLQGQMIVYQGGNRSGFERAFRHAGTVFRR